MPVQFNQMMLTNILSSALTSTVTAWLSYLAAWSHFSSADNSALATVIAAGLAILIGSGVSIFFNRTSAVLNAAAQGGTKVITPTQAAADAVPANANVMGPEDARVVTK